MSFTGPGFNAGISTGGPQFAGANDPAVQYVNLDGSDRASGSSWGSAKATVNAAIAALPANGGTIEIGYGTYAPFSVPSNRGAITIRGRGMGQTYDTSNNVNNPYHPTVISAAGGDGIDVIGPNNLGPSGSPPQYGIFISDLAVVGAAGGGYGINVQYSPRISLQRVAVDLCPLSGIQLGPACYWVEFDTVVATRNGTVGASGITGGLLVNTTGGQVNLIRGKACAFNFNFGYGAALLQAQVVSFDETDFSQNLASAVGGSGKGVLSGNAGPYTFDGCWFENNAGPHSYRPNAAGGIHNFSGCFFLGNGTQPQYALSSISPTDRYIVIACNFVGHSSGWSIDNGNGAPIFWQGCTTTDSTGFIQGVGNTAATNVGLAAAFAGGCTATSTVAARGTQTLLSAGAVTIDATKGDSAQITLSANATSSTINNGSPGQMLNIQWIQDGTGSRTYVWPAACRFAAGTAPTATTTANHLDSVTFIYTGSLWLEVYRSIGVPTT